MKRQSFILFFIVVALVGAAAAACVYMKDHRRLGRPGVRLVAQPSFDASNQIVRSESVALPETILDLTSQAWPIAADELQTLPADTIFGRRLYRVPDEFSLMVNAVLMGVDSRSIHKPEICLPAQGWTIQEEPATIPVAKPFPYELPVMKVFGKKAGRTADGREQLVAAVVVYWFVADDRITASHLERMWQMGETILRTGTLQRWALISCSAFCAPGQEPETFERVKRYLAAAVPEFQLATGPARLPPRRRPPNDGFGRGRMREIVRRRLRCLAKSVKSAFEKTRAWIMLRRHRQIRMQIQQLLDACLFAVSFWLAYGIRANPVVIDALKLPPVAFFDAPLWFYLVLIPAAPLVLESQGFYNRSMYASRRAMLWSLLRGCFLVTIGLTLLLFLFHYSLPRLVFFSFGGFSFLLVWFREELVRLGYKTQFTRAQLNRRFILVGNAEETARMRKEIKARPEEGIEVLAELDLITTPVERLVDLLHEHSANGVILSARHAYFEQVETAIRACEIEGVEAWLVAEFFNTQLSRTSFDDFFGRPVMVFRSAPEASWQGLLKQVLDLVCALILLILFSWLLLLIALAIKITSPGPVLFRQKRAGLNGQPFTMYKFRTMVSNAEQLRAELEALNEMTGPVFKVSNDPRVTRFGTFLRKSSLDEWPQLLNVLRGEMSLVGPRPLPVDEVSRFDDVAHRRRLSVKPGLTCLWQVRGRNQIVDFKDWVRLDLEYIDNWSLWLDFKILLRTIPVVLSGVGAK